MSSDVITLGWREWVGLADLGISSIKAKIDTGARTSALHAFDVHPFTEDYLQKVEFKIHPLHGDKQTVASCFANVVDQRDVRDSGGHLETRWVIESALSINSQSWPIEITLTSRYDMKFRMLLGRSAMHGRIRVDPSRSYLLGKKRKIR